MAKKANGVSRDGGWPSGKPPEAAITPARLSGAVRPSMQAKRVRPEEPKAYTRRSSSARRAWVSAQSALMTLKFSSIGTWSLAS